MLSTAFLVGIGRIFFRAENMQQAIGYLSGICSLSFFDMFAMDDGGKRQLLCLLLSMILLLVEWFGRRKQHALERIPVRSRVFRWMIYMIIAGMVMMMGGAPSPFIYFQF
jgi:hypothetical protein